MARNFVGNCYKLIKEHDVILCFELQAVFPPFRTEIAFMFLRRKFAKDLPTII